MSDRKDLIEDIVKKIGTCIMPFGKYKNTKISQIYDYNYLVWLGSDKCKWINKNHDKELIQNVKNKLSSNKILFGKQFFMQDINDVCNTYKGRKYLEWIMTDDFKYKIHHN
jgi:hypothetical protein